MNKPSEPKPPKPRNNHLKIEALDKVCPDPSEIFRITKISQAVKNPNRANIFINDKFSFSLDITQLAGAKLKIGQGISTSELDHLKQASDFGKLYQRTLEWALTCPRSIKETRDYLVRKQATPTNITTVIAKLTAKNYLDDEEFARTWVENRRTRQGISRRRLELELRQKGITQNIIDQTLAETTRDESIDLAKIIAKKRSKYDDQQLIQYLVRQGFDYQSAKTAVHETDSQNSA